MNKLALLLIKFYQYSISPLLGSGKCRYEPTCSEYGRQAYEKYGFFKATFKTIYRILRCNPFSKGGYDPLD